MDDVAYVPSVEGRWTDLGSGVTSCLVLGEPTGGLLSAAEQGGWWLRIADGAPWAGVLHAGTYTLRREEGAVLLVVMRGLSPTEPSAGQQRYLQGHLGLVEPVFSSMWSQAKAVATQAGVVEGDMVRLRGTGDLGTVTSVRLVAGEYEAEVLGPRGVQTMDVDALEVIAGDPRDPSFWVSQPGGTADDLALTITWTKLRNPLTDTIYSFASSKTIFRPYQFTPVLKLLASANGRLLIADEVGLGKTIEAGLIWSELEQRSPLERVLVVTPASLRLKWKSEMNRRFDRELTLMTPQDLLDLARQMAQGRDPRIAGVVSIESLRRATDTLQALTEVHARFDLVIVDEAHALRTRGGRGHEMGQFLSDWADVLLFLSATPLNLGQSDLFNLVNMLAEDEFADEAIFEAQLEPNQALNAIVRRLRDDRAVPRKLLVLAESIHDMELGAAVTARPDFSHLCRILDRDGPLTTEQVAAVKRLASSLNTLGSVLTRTRKADVPEAKAKREAKPVKVEWTDQERALYQGIRDRFTRESLARGTPVGFGLQMPLRQAASCLPAMQENVRRKMLDVAVDFEADDDEEEGELEIDELEQGEEVELDVPDLLEPLDVDSKLEALLEKLQALRESGVQQAMIFSFFTGTIRYLEQRLSADFTVRSMTGRTPMDERQRIMEDFRAGKFEILLLSQVGAEGLDFEFCNVIVNYDLPWNPMQVEQRIGRLDRFGQQHEKIFVFNMTVPGTIEADIFERLYSRIGVFERSIGELEPILRDDLREITKTLLDPQLSDADREKESDRVAIALAERAAQVRQLEESRGTLSTVDQLQVDGMTDDGPADGRYVGPSEVRRLIERLLAACGGKLTPPSRLGICRLTGSQELAKRLRSLDVRRSGSLRPLGQLAAELATGRDIRVTFDSDVASRHEVELISSRHPLVDLALKVLEESELSLRRFGVVGVPGIAELHRSFAVRLDLASSSGLRPQLELWATAVDLDSGAQASEFGPALLDALARGLFVDVDHAPHHLLTSRLSELESLAAVRRREVQRERRADNQALVDARVASQLRSITLKLEKAKATLREVVERQRDERVVRLHEGRIRNLQLDLERIRATLEGQRDLDITSSPVALLQVHAM